MKRRITYRIAILILLVAVLSVIGFGNSGDDEGYYSFIPNSIDGTISVYNSTKGEITRKIKVSEESIAHGIEITPDGKYLYTGIMSGKDLLVLDPFTGKEITTIDIGNNLHGIDLNQDGKQVFVTDQTEGGLIIFDAKYI